MRVEEKDSLVVDPLEIVALNRPEKFAYVNKLLSSEEKKTAITRIVREHRCIRLESLKHGQDQPNVGLS